MLIIIYLLFFSILSVKIALKYNREVVEIIPVIFSAFVLCLYVLAFFNRMWFMDIIAVSAIIFIFVTEYRKNNFGMVEKYLTKLFKPSVLVFAAVSVVGIILLSGRGIWSNDDVVFWTIDTRTIFSLQGFSLPDFHTVPEYGDYPPISQIIEAWFMHMVGKLDEGLMFSAYFLAMQIYTAPILKNLPSKIIPALMSFVWLFFIFSVGPNVLYDLSADVLMGIIYGSILMLTFYWKNKSPAEYAALSIMLSVLALTKSVGIQWALFAIVFILLLEQPVLKLKKRKLFLTAPVFAWVSWNVFCRISGRTTYLTEILKSSVTEQSNSELYLQYGQAMKESFFKALSLNQQTSVVKFGLSIVEFIILFLTILFICKVFKLINDTEFKKIFSFMLIAGIVEYTILLFSVLNMFISETWYTQPELMLVLLKRYGSPYIIGFMLIVLCIIFERINISTFDFLKINISEANKKQIVWILIILVHFLFVPFGQEIKKYVTYHNNPSPDIYNYNEAVAKQDIEKKKPHIISTIDLLNTINNKHSEKVLILHDETVWKTYDFREIRYYAAPLSVFSQTVENLDKSSLAEYISNNGYTAICFISDDAGWPLLSQFDTEEKLEPFTIYNLEVFDDKIYIGEF